MSGAGTPQRVLVARLDNCGDVLLTGPAVRAVAEQGRGVVMLCGPRGRAAAEVLPGVDHLVQFRAPWIEPDPMPVRATDGDHLVEAVRRLGIAEALIFGSSHQSPLPLALLLRWAGVERIAAVSHEHAGSLLDVRIKGDPDIHEVERNLQVAEGLGYDRPTDLRLRIDLGGPAAPPGTPRARQLVLGRFAPGRYVVVHPGATAPARTLTPERWAMVVERLVHAGWTVLVTGSRQERGLTAAVTGHHRGVVDLGGRTTFRALGRLLEGAAAFVGGNTGPMHLAAAAGAPVVAVFPPTVPLERWRPWRVPHVVLGDQGVPCAGCRARECPLPEQVCLGPVDAGAVEQAVEALTAGPAPAVVDLRDPDGGGPFPDVPDRPVVTP